MTRGEPFRFCHCEEGVRATWQSVVRPVIASRRRRRGNPFAWPVSRRRDTSPILPRFLPQRGAEGGQLHPAVRTGPEAQIAGHVPRQLPHLGPLGVHGAEAAAHGGADPLVEGAAVVGVLQDLLEAGLARRGGYAPVIASRRRRQSVLSCRGIRIPTSAGFARLLGMTRGEPFRFCHCEEGVRATWQSVVRPVIASRRRRRGNPYARRFPGDSHVARLLGMTGALGQRGGVGVLFHDRSFPVILRLTTPRRHRLPVHRRGVDATARPFRSVLHTVGPAASRSCQSRQAGAFLESASLHPPQAALRCFPLPTANTGVGLRQEPCFLQLAPRRVRCGPLPSFICPLRRARPSICAPCGGYSEWFEGDTDSHGPAALGMTTAETFRF